MNQPNYSSVSEDDNFAAELFAARHQILEDKAVCEILAAAGPKRIAELREFARAKTGSDALSLTILNDYLHGPIAFAMSKVTESLRWTSLWGTAESCPVYCEFINHPLAKPALQAEGYFGLVFGRGELCVLHNDIPRDRSGEHEWGIVRDYGRRPIKLVIEPLSGIGRAWTGRGAV